MKKSKIKDGLYTVGFMFATTFVTVSAVSLLQIATADIVSRNESLYIKEAILRSARIDIPETPEDTAALYDKIVKPAPGLPVAFTVGPEAEKLALIRSGPGLWGEITAVVCFNMITGEIVGISFTAHNETPGLGARIEEPWFQRQFFGKRGPLELVPEGTGSDNPVKVDAITGATITSKAVRDIVNKTVSEAENTQTLKKTEQI